MKQPTSQPNPFSESGAEFFICNSERFSPPMITNGEGEPIVVSVSVGRYPLRVEQELRMLSFAGKLHFAAAGAAAYFEGIAEQLRTIAGQAGSLPAEQLTALLTELASNARAYRDEVQQAVHGAELTGEEARQFDARWQQDGTIDNLQFLRGASVAQLRLYYPEISEAAAQNLLESCRKLTTREALRLFAKVRQQQGTLNKERENLQVLVNSPSLQLANEKQG